MSNASRDAPVQPVATTIAPAIDIRGLAKSYGDVHAVRGLDLTKGCGSSIRRWPPTASAWALRR